MWEKVSNFLKGQIVTSIIYIALGACMAFMPVDTVNIICKLVFGILLILVGVYHIIIYVAEKLNSTIMDLAAGAVLLVMGWFLFNNPQVVIKVLPTLLGTFILVDSLWGLKGAFKLKKRGRGRWKFMLLFSLVFVGLGVAMIVNPFTMVTYTIMFAGWVFLCNGVFDLIFWIMLRTGLKELKQDVTAVEAEGRIVDETDGTYEDTDTIEAWGSRTAGQSTGDTAQQSNADTGRNDSADTAKPTGSESIQSDGNEGAASGTYREGSEGDSGSASGEENKGGKKKFGRFFGKKQKKQAQTEKTDKDNEPEQDAALGQGSTSEQDAVEGKWTSVPEESTEADSSGTGDEDSSL